MAKSNPGQSSPSKGERKVELPATMTVKQLAETLGISGVEVIKQLMQNGVMAGINQTIDYDTAAIIASDMGFEVREKAEAEAEVIVREEDEKQLKPRPPVVTVMGHIDHGKTKLLDAIRQTNVVASEAGGITQHIGAYQVETHGRKITFLDTPGHEAFTAMRARGAKVTDVAVLVVAADDGVMPQTLEAIDHAKAAGVPIVVALNKIDKPNVNLDRVKQQLAEAGLVVEEWGGNTVCVPVSAKMKKGITDLLESILVVAEMLELKANPDCPASGVVIEAGLDKTKGPMATVLVERGTLNPGDPVVVGDTWGKVKAMFNDVGKRVKKAGPATPVKILGLNAAPQAGDTFVVTATDREARATAERRQLERQQKIVRPVRPVKLDDVYAQIKAGQAKELNLILKTDVQGSIEPIKNSLERLEFGEVKVKIIHSGSGNITEGDVLLALASKGVIIGFHTTPTVGAQRLAEAEGVDIRLYDIIYDLVEDVERAMKGLKEPEYAEVTEGRAEVRAVFAAGKKEKAAGLMVTEGRLRRDSLVKVIRKGQVVHQSKITSLRRFKDDVKEVAAGMECGLVVDGFSAFEPGDIIEVFRREKVG
ncbi:MAG: translation initiation factor IF-2 [Dehalococcoidia bacterium]|nr:translation initiation factor IF-2 [Dehalococcoidia bacterium]